MDVIKKCIQELQDLAKFQQCPNPTGSVVSSKVRDKILEIANELQTAWNQLNPTYGP